MEYTQDTRVVRVYCIYQRSNEQKYLLVRYCTCRKVQITGVRNVVYNAT